MPTRAPGIVLPRTARQTPDPNRWSGRVIGAGARLLPQLGRMTERRSTFVTAPATQRASAAATTRIGGRARGCARASPSSPFSRDVAAVARRRARSVGCVRRAAAPARDVEGGCGRLVGWPREGGFARPVLDRFLLGLWKGMAPRCGFRLGAGWTGWVVGGGREESGYVLWGNGEPPRLVRGVQTRSRVVSSTVGLSCGSLEDCETMTGCCGVAANGWAKEWGADVGGQLSPLRRSDRHRLCPNGQQARQDGGFRANCSVEVSSKLTERTCCMPVAETGRLTPPLSRNRGAHRKASVTGKQRDCLWDGTVAGSPFTARVAGRHP